MARQKIIGLFITISRSVVNFEGVCTDSMLLLLLLLLLLLSFRPSIVGKSCRRCLSQCPPDSSRFWMSSLRLVWHVVCCVNSCGFESSLPKLICSLMILVET